MTDPSSAESATTANPYNPPTAPVTEAEQPTEVSADEPLAIGGWMMLVALGVVLTPLRISYFLITVYPPIFTDGTWEALTSPSSPSYSPIWGPFLIGEVLVNLTFVLMSLFAAYLMFSKRATFPKWYAAIAFGSALFIVVDAYIATLVMPSVSMFDPETIREFARSLVSCLIWTPYLFLSKRAKATFIR